MATGNLVVGHCKRKGTTPLFLRNSFLVAAMSFSGDSLQRTVSGVVSVLLSLKKSPLIRYKDGSDIARRVAEGTYGKPL